MTERRETLSLGFINQIFIYSFIYFLACVARGFVGV